MKTDIENNEWKAEAPYLAGLQKDNPFHVPEQYFETLPDTITNSVYLHELKEGTNTHGFIVPDQYFNSLQERILTAANTAVITDRLPSSDGFSVPDQYFQQLQSKLMARTAAGEATLPEISEEVLPARTPSKIVRLWHSGLLKYASAACFILVTTFGLYLNQQRLTNDSSANEMANEQMLYDISEQDVIDHVQGNTTEEQKNNADLETYILNNYSQSDLSSAL